MADLLYREKVDGIVILTLNRPEVFNALSRNLIIEIKDAILEAEKNAAVGAIILTGAGKAFCAGGDLDEMLDLSEVTYEERREFLSLFRDMIEAIRGISKPVIAAVNGYCIGGGNEINIACDLTVASEDAKFGQAGPKVGSAPLLGGTQLLPLLVGEKRAKEMVYLCNPVSAKEALDMGLVNRVVPKENLMEEALSVAGEVLTKSPAAIGLAKLSHNSLFKKLVSASMEEGIEELARFWGTGESKEGLNAFKEKRLPKFR